MSKLQDPKKFLSWEDQVSTVNQVIDPSEDLISQLKTKNYYRLSGYWFHMRYLVSDRTKVKAKAREVRTDNFRPGHSFEEVKEIYQWDARLREILFRAIAEIEVALRTQVSYVLGRRHPFAHRCAASFSPNFHKKPTLRRNLMSMIKKGRRRRSEFEQWQSKIDNSIARERGSDDSIAHQIDKYGDVHIWSLVEILEFWQVIIAFDNLHSRDSEEILSFFKAPDRRILSSQLAALNSLRNKIAHHSRIWNRNLDRAPALPTEGTDDYFDGIPRNNQVSHYRIYPLICVLARWMESLEFGDSWKQELFGHLKQFPAIQGYSLSSGGFPEAWESLPLWNNP